MANLRASWSARIPPPVSGNQTVTFARRSQSGKNITSSGNVELSKDFLSYHVQIPPSPDNQPMPILSASTDLDPSISARVEEQYVSNSLFTGGFNSATRAQLMEKVIDSEAIHPQMAGAKGSSCAVSGCGAKVMHDERGDDILPCECGYKICRDCFLEELKADGTCPGCKEVYRGRGGDEAALAGMWKKEKRLSMMRSRKYGEFESKGTYGYGNAIWPRENEDGEGVVELVSKPWRPLTRRLKIPAAVLSPYR